VFRVGRLGPPQGGPALAQALAELGYIQGNNLILENREDLPESDGIATSAIAELLSLQPDVIVVSSTMAAQALVGATDTVPIVAAGGGGGGADLIASGLVPGLARPGKNLTGVTVPPTLDGKRLQLLTEVVPGTSRVAVLHYPQGSQARRVAELEDAARHLGIQLLRLGISTPDELASAVGAVARDRVDALLVMTGPVTLPARGQLLDLVRLYRLPTVSDVPNWAREGGLLSYGADPVQLNRRVAYYVDRILKGTKPADLPIEQPTTFDFVINLKTAQALGLTIPQHVLLQATEVIQ